MEIFHFTSKWENWSSKNLEKKIRVPEDGFEREFVADIEIVGSSKMLEIKFEQYQVSIRPRRPKIVSIYKIQFVDNLLVIAISGVPDALQLRKKGQFS